MFCDQSLFSHYKKGVHKDQLTDYPRDSLKPLILITFYPMPLHLRILRFFQVERIWYFLFKLPSLLCFYVQFVCFQLPTSITIVIFIHITLFTVQHGYPIITQCSESFSYPIITQCSESFSSYNLKAQQETLQAILFQENLHFVFCSPKGTIMKIRSISDLYYAIPATVS